jgi:hypothetical protein
MYESLCNTNGCPERVINKFVAAILAYICSTIVLGLPILNAFGADVRDIANLTPYHISWTGVALTMLLLVSGFLGAVERHTNPLMCCISSLGIPGLILAVITALGTKVF